MRPALFFNPRLLCERLAIESIRKRRLAELRGTPAAGLALAHIDSLELLKLAREAGIDTIYDIGASVGTWSLLAKSLIPNANIHAFEPLAKHQSEFHKKLDCVTEVTMHPIALGARNAIEKFHVTDFSDSSSILRPNELSKLHLGVTEAEQITLSVHRLDEYRRERNLPSPDLLKLDIQGYELEALRGAPECLAAAKAVIAEVSFVEYYDGQCLFHELAYHLAQAGLFLTAFAAVMPTGRPVGQTDALFTRSMAKAECR